MFNTHKKKEKCSEEKKKKAERKEPYCVNFVPNPKSKKFNILGQFNLET